MAAIQYDSKSQLMRRFFWTCWLYVFCLYAASASAQEVGEIVVTFEYAQMMPALAQYTPAIECVLLADQDDLLARIEALREQSKATLEPLIKQYMATAEQLIQLAGQSNSAAQHEKAVLAHRFKMAETDISDTLAHYRAEIDALLQHHTLRAQKKFSFLDTCHFENILAGRYRIYGIMTFSTTALKWFEPVVVKGGDRYPVNLTRDNLMNPYWTELNWWSFMNLDFSKHH